MLFPFRGLLAGDFRLSVLGDGCCIQSRLQFDAKRPTLIEVRNGIALLCILPRPASIRRQKLTFLLEVEAFLLIQKFVRLLGGG